MQSIKEVVKLKFPETMDEFERINQEQIELFAKKQHDYGPGNISMGGNKELALLGIAIRTNDKVQRLLNILHNNKGKTAVNETIVDTLQDLSIYGIIAQILNNDKWGK